MGFPNRLLGFKAKVSRRGLSLLSVSRETCSTKVSWTPDFLEVVTVSLIFVKGRVNMCLYKDVAFVTSFLLTEALYESISEGIEFGYPALRALTAWGRNSFAMRDPSERKRKQEEDNARRAHEAHMKAEEDRRRLASTI